MRAWAVRWPSTNGKAPAALPRLPPTHSRSPGRASASTWRANTVSKPKSLPAAVSSEVSVVSATAKTPGKSAVELPWSALTKNLSDPAVWLVDGEGKAQLHKVSVARYLTGKVIVGDGLKGGETVVIAGGQLLHPDMQVEVADPADIGVTQ